MKTKWDYTEAAAFYAKRPGYALSIVDKIMDIANVKSGDWVCDIGAGTGNLTLMLAKKNLNVIAVEPNEFMRTVGAAQTAACDNVRWHDALAEDTRLPADGFRLVTYASSFNVTDRQKSLIEAHRILKSDGFIACLWNNRDLDDPLHSQIERLLKIHVPDYDCDRYGVRYEDQTRLIKSSNLFDDVQCYKDTFKHRFSRDDFIDNWRSHGTMHPQSKRGFSLLIEDIKRLLESLDDKIFSVSYITQVWTARKMR